jgi:hypothetical protein
MALMGSFVGIYAGIRTGFKKNTPGEQWAALLFKCAEAYKGVRIAEHQINQPNLTIFPSDNFDFNSVKEGQKYQLILGVGRDKGGTRFDLVEIKPIG